MSALTCHTAGCPNQDLPIEMGLTVVDPDTGALVYVDSVVCGACGQPITDVVPPFTAGGPGG